MDKIIGLGSAGISILTEIANEQLDSIELVAIDSDQNSFLQSKAHTTLLLTNSSTEAEWTTAHARELAEANQNAIYEILTNTKRLILTYGLGGCTGAGAAPVVARLAHVLGVSEISAVVIHPFTFEGTVRATNADKNLIQLRANLQNVDVVQSDDLLRFVNKRSTRNKTYSVISRMAMWHILSYLVK